MSFVRQMVAVVVGMWVVCAGDEIPAQTVSTEAGVDLSAVSFSRSLEDRVKQPIKIEVKRISSSGEVVAFLDEMQPGRITLDLSFLEADSYRVYVSSPGYAMKSYSLDVRGGKAYRLPPADTLFRKRYAIIRFVVNTAGERTFEGADVEQGQFVVSEGGQMPRFFSDWRFGQRAEDVVFDFVWMSKGHGVVRAPEGASFEQLSEAPAPDAYRWDYISATSGLILFFRNRGSINAKNECYSKLIVESITEAPPTDELGKVSSVLPSSSSSKTNTSSQIYPPKLRSSIALSEQTIVSRSSAVPLRIALEDNAKGSIGITLKRNAPALPSVGKLKEVEPGDLVLDLSWLDPDAYFVFPGAPGYANAFFEMEVKNGKVTLPTNNVTLYRMRYAVIRYSINNAGKRTLEGADVEQGRFLAYQGSGLIPTLRDEWFVAQRSANVVLQRQAAADSHGVATAPTGTPFEQLTEAPANDAYHYDTTALTTGLILFFRSYKDGRYGKLLVEGISETPPADAKILDPKH